MLICQRCQWQTHDKMLTGYALRNLACDRCGRIGDLAIVQAPTIARQQEALIDTEYESSEDSDKQNQEDVK